MNCNILYIHSHDTGRALSPYGAPVQTPQFERLAVRSLTFTNAFSAAPTCSPSRSALLSGLYPHELGMTGLAHRGFRWNDYRFHLARILKEAGWHTALCGVQHEAPKKTMIGYDEILESRDDGKLEPPGRPDRANTETALDFLERRSLEAPETPFFLSMGFEAVHRPYPDVPSVPETAGTGDSADEAPPKVSPGGPYADASDEAAFIADIERLDSYVGRLWDVLDRLGLWERSIVLYTTDHGPAFPGMKGTLTDKGTGVAMMLALPAALREAYPRIPLPGSRIDGLVSQIDVVPALVTLLGIEAPLHLQGRGCGLLDEYLDAPIAEPSGETGGKAVFSETNFHAAYEPARSVRTSRYRFIRHYGEPRPPIPVNTDASSSKERAARAGCYRRIRPRRELYDVLADPEEQRNLAENPSRESRESIMSGLDERMRRWMHNTGDPLLRGDISPPPGARIDSPDAWDPGQSGR